MCDNLTVTVYLRATNVFCLFNFTGWPKNHTLIHWKDKKFQNGKFKDFCDKMPLRHFFAQSTFFFVQFTRRKKNHTLAQLLNKKSQNGKFKHFCATICRNGISSCNEKMQKVRANFGIFPRFFFDFFSIFFRFFFDFFRIFFGFFLDFFRNFWIFCYFINFLPFSSQ